MVLHDLRYALRSLVGQPLFSLLAMATLALGIGADTAIFTVADATLRRPLPYPEADHLMSIRQTRPDEAFHESEATYPDFVDWREQSRAFGGLAAYQEVGVTVRGDEGNDLAPAATVSDGFFEVLGVAPALGRAFTRADCEPGAPKVAMLTHAEWTKRFGADPAVVGRTLSLDRPYTVIGVLPRGYAFAPLVDLGIYLPLSPEGQERTRRNLHWLPVIGRLAPGASREQAAAEMTGIAARLAAAHPESGGSGAIVAPLAERIVGKVRGIVLLLLAAVGLVLLVACANVANLMLARATSRQKELAIRAALGAGRGRLVAQLVGECLLVSLAGGALGTVLALWGIDVMTAVIPKAQLATMPWLATLHIDAVALLFALALSLVTGAGVGIVPALQASRPDVHLFLKEEGRSTPTRARARLRDAFVIGEVAVAFVLLVGAALIGRSLWSVLRVDPGFDPAKVLTIRFSLPEQIEDPQAVVLHDELLARVAALPGVTGVATTSQLPLKDGGNTINYVVVGRPDPGRAGDLEAHISAVSASYFETMGVPLVAGRRFDARDRAGAGAGDGDVAIVNQALARRIFPAGAVGERLRFTFKDGLPPMEIVGVVGDEKMGSLDAPAAPAIYRPYAQAPSGWTALVVRAADAGRLGQAARRALAAVNPEIAVFDVETMAGRVAGSPWMFVRRFPAVLVTAFAAIALLLAVIGLYGVVSYSVGQRTREIGIRRAVGARRRDIVRLILARAIGLVLAGTAIGLAASSALAGLLRGLLFGVGAHDPLTLAGAALLLVGVTALACLVPIRRALRVDPMTALR